MVPDSRVVELYRNYLGTLSSLHWYLLFYGLQAMTFFFKAVLSESDFVPILHLVLNWIYTKYK